MLFFLLTTLLSTAFAAEMPFCQEISTDSAFGEVYKIQSQIANMTTGFHCRGDHGERISGWPTEASSFHTQCGNNLFAGETCYTGDQDEAIALLKKLGEKSIGASHSLRDVKKRGDLIVYSIQDKKGRIAPMLDQLSAGRCTEKSFEP